MAGRKPSPRRRRSSKNFVVLKIDASLALSTLATDTVLAGDMIDLNDDVKIISSDLVWTLRDLTPGEGPIIVGLNSDAYSVTNILEAVDASPSDRGDLLSLENAGRNVRVVGSFDGQLANNVLNDGKMIRTRKMYWKFAANRDLQMFALNRSGGTLTTGANLRVIGNLYAEWQ